MRSGNYLDVVLETPWDAVNSWWTSSDAKRKWGVKVAHLKMQQWVTWPKMWWRKTTLYLSTLPWSKYDVMVCCGWFVCETFKIKYSSYIYIYRTYIYIVYLFCICKWQLFPFRIITILLNLHFHLQMLTWFQAYLISKRCRSFLCFWKTKFIRKFENAARKKTCK